VKSGKINLENLSEQQLIAFMKTALESYHEKEMGKELATYLDKLLLNREQDNKLLRKELETLQRTKEKWDFVKTILNAKQKDQLIDKF
jgi:hypothetical protein